MEEISFGAFDSELMHQEINIPEGFTATIKGDKIILTRTESEDERIRKSLIKHFREYKSCTFDGLTSTKVLAWLERQDKGTNWKPSKEEMDVLYGLAYITNQYDEHKEEVITRLYQDLKREFFNGSSYENMFPNTEDGVRRRSTIQVLEYARSLDTYNQYGKADIDKNIAWLEKQGKIDEDLIAKKFLINKGYPIDANGTFPTYEELYNIIREGLENQCEQKETLCDKCKKEQPSHSCQDITALGRCYIEGISTSNKVKPKFKVGNWYQCTKDFFGRGVTFDKNTAYYCAKEGCLQNEYGCHIAIVKSLYDNFKLWTIDDAKKGDILADKYGVYIYDQLDISDESACVSICGYQYSDKKFEPESMICNKSDFYPATKEQRDTLLKAMADAGYAFDFEKKELKKIDNEEVNGEDYGIDGLWHAQRILEKTLGSVDGYQSDDGILSHKCAITAVKKLYEQKPTEWCEEDEQYLLVCKNALAKYQTTDKWDADIISCWLENKLKAPQNRWKPSDKQITVLELASKYERVFTPKQIDILIGLKEQLKKLKKIKL